MDAAKSTLRVELTDGPEPGLRLRVTSRSARWSVLIRKTPSVRLRVPLGEWPTVGIAAARASARALRAQLAGSDPEQIGPITLGTLLEQYSRRRLSQLKRGHGVKLALTALFKDLRHRDAETLTRRDIVLAIDKVAETAPVHANRMLAYAKAFFSWSLGRGYLESNPAIGVPKVVCEVSRERTPSVTELVEIWRAADVIGYPFGHAIQLLMLTAARRDEVGSISLGELDLPAGSLGGCWTLPASRSKNGRVIRVPLSAGARQVVERALNARTAAGPYLFTTTGLSSVSGWSRAKRRVDLVIAVERKRAGRPTPMEPWRLHDLRRAFATAACDTLNIDPAVADRCLNHVGASTTSTISRVYGRNEMFDQRKEALDLWAELLEETRRSPLAEDVHVRSGPTSATHRLVKKAGRAND